VCAATGVSSETVRRYLLGQRPSTDFIVHACLHYGISANWLLLGIGPQRLADLPLTYVKLASSNTLVEELAGRAKEYLARGEQAIELKPASSNSVPSSEP